jgi:GR25 family glycosyltransferase involved in LPS biosynthesis
MKEKLTNFPPVYYVSLSDSTDRQQAFEKQFLLSGIENVKMIEAYDGRKDDYRYKPDIVDGLHFGRHDSGGIAAIISHLKAIIEWYNNSDSDYAIFFEDDMSIESVNDWNFTWDEFISILPKNWKAIQLSLIKDNITHDDMKLNHRVCWKLFD